MLQVYDLQAPLKVLHPSQIGWQLQQEPQAGPTRSRTSKGGRGTENAPPQQLTDGAHPQSSPLAGLWASRRPCREGPILSTAPSRPVLHLHSAFSMAPFSSQRLKLQGRAGNR